jgi:predicted MFS family arabinose efflux permease
MGILGPMTLGNLIDRYRCLRKILIIQPILIAGLILLTHFMLESSFPDVIVILLIAFTGAPIQSIGVSSYQLAAQVTYPVNEVFGVGIMNTVNKLISFVLIIFSNYLTPQSMLVFWSFIGILAVIPALMFKRKQQHHGERASHVPQLRHHMKEDDETKPILMLKATEIDEKKYGTV